MSKVESKTKERSWDCTFESIEKDKWTGVRSVNTAERKLKGSTVEGEFEEALKDAEQFASKNGLRLKYMKGRKPES
jgi:hypothetical protein